MNIAFISEAAQLGGTVFTVLIFIWYLAKRDDKWTRAIEKQGDSNIALARAFQKLIDTVERNIEAVKKNIPATERNTAVVSENTEVVKETNGNGKH